MSTEIEPGDHVHHAPSGEDWVVLRVIGEYLEPAGWPRSQSLLADCTLIRKGTPEQRQEMIDYVERGRGGGA
jgi:hypothetical protein